MKFITLILRLRNFMRRQDSIITTEFRTERKSKIGDGN